MKRHRISNAIIAEIYEQGIKCRNRKESIGFFAIKSNELNVPYESLRSIIRSYCTRNKLPSVDKVISERNIKELNKLISKNPNNIRGCIRKYAESQFPELIGFDSLELDRIINSYVKLWYATASKKSVCFMTIGSRGATVVNRKNSTKINDNYTKGFFKSIKKRIVDLFRIF